VLVVNAERSGRLTSGDFWVREPAPPSITHHKNLAVSMDRASQVLAQVLPLDVPRTHAVLLERGNVPISTLRYRKLERRSKEALAQS
jgi:hypothetical protein